MQMDGWVDYLHISFDAEHVLFSGLRLTSFSTFIVAATLSTCVCLAERFLTFALSRHWVPFRTVRQSRTHNALWRAGLYSLATLLRLLYMLLSMTFHIWLILVIVLSLAVGQFLIEYHEHEQDLSSYSAAADHRHRNIYHHQFSLLPPSPPRMRKVRACKTKPAGLFIHPNDSNIARADAVAVELGLRGSTERGTVLRTSSDSDDDHPMWERGRGRDAARALFGGSTQQQARTNMHAHSRSDSQQRLFQVGNSDSDSED